MQNTTRLCYNLLARKRGIMKRFYNYTFTVVCMYIFTLSILTLGNTEINIDNYTANVKNINEDKKVDSIILTQNNDKQQEESIIEVENNSTPKEQPKEEENKVETKPTQEDKTPNDTSSYTVLSQETVNISHYGHDCYGCTSGKTASGYYVGDGKIYYEDNNFGSVRIIAADKKYPLGTIVRINNKGTIIVAIVLDRGGGIGNGKKFQVDLLTTSNAYAYELGIITNANMEVLRLGY